MKRNFNHFNLDRLVHRSDKYSLYFVQSDEEKGLLKVLNDGPSSQAFSGDIDNEYEISLKLETSAALKVSAKGYLHGKAAILLENFEGISLDEFCRESLDMGLFLDLACKISESLVQIHSRNVVHRDIKPSNIIYHKESHELKFADFGIAILLENEGQLYANSLSIEGSFPFMSPEQTGRIHHPIDFRSDLYSLGITLFKMLTGSLPFQANDVLEWVHSHIARKPLTVKSLKPEVPEMLSQIINKLLEKLPELRYQTAAGLLADLRICQRHWEKEKKIHHFDLGSKDLSERLSIPHKLYGREQDLQLLYTIFTRTVEVGTPEFVLVSGYSGIGKTSLVQELYRPLVQNRGIYASGKFDQFKRHIPYYAITSALCEIIGQLLILDEGKLRDWKNILLQELSGNGKLLTDLLPELKLIIGEQPEVPTLGFQESQNRFTLHSRILSVHLQVKINPSSSSSMTCSGLTRPAYLVLKQSLQTLNCNTPVLYLPTVKMK